MKKFVAMSLVVSLVLATTVSAFAEEMAPQMGGQGQMGGQMMELTDEMLAEIDALGITVEEYMAMMQPEMQEGMEGGMRGEMQEGMEGEMRGEMQGELAPQMDATQLATAISSTVYVDGIEIAFEAYTINDNNYFKLRDLAEALSSSSKAFSVSWESSLNAINLISNSTYTSVGGELAAGDDTAKSYTPTTSTIYVDGMETAFDAYTINDNSYFKLRDICSTFDIGVTWDSTTGNIGIDSSISYQ